MKNAILIPLLIFTSYNFAQEKRKVERLWVSANFGFTQYAEVGAQIQLFDQFLLGAYYQTLKRNVGPGVPTNPYALLFKDVEYKQDNMSSGALMIGFASPTPHSVMFSFLAGPSLNKSITHSGFETTNSTSSTYYTYPVSVSSTRTERWKVGLNYKATVSFIIKNRVCINLGLAGNYNGIDNYNRFIVGIGAGEFGCFARPSRR